MLFTREEALKAVEENHPWDIIVIGGGATGLGTALDAASRGYHTLLLEQSDFAKGTSSRSTKLIHGGVRYLAQGDVGLVHEALKERWLLLQNAPHVVRKLEFIIPCYSRFALAKYFVGSKLYDWLAVRHSLGKAERVTSAEVLSALPGVRSRGLIGGIRYFDAQFDDARLAINLAQTGVEKGGVILNYMRVTGLIKEHGRVTGVTAMNMENQHTHTALGRAVINATGVFVDDVLQMDVPDAKPIIRPSQGIHLVLDRSFLGGSSALLIPETSDGRVLFAVPWHDRLLVGTTDTPLESPSLEPVALKDEITFVLATAGRYLLRRPAPEDVLSVFAGMRPLAAPKTNKKSTKEISRSHKLIVSPSGLITITGGKWTTYRKMAEDTVNKAIEVAGLQPVPCRTAEIEIHGYMERTATNGVPYGADEVAVSKLAAGNPALSERLNDRLPFTKAEVVWSVRNEMARTLEDVMARRMRILFLDARQAIKLAPEVATIMAKELNYGSNWITDQVEKFTMLAQNYLSVF